MKKWYVVYLAVMTILCGAGLIVLNKLLSKTRADIAAIEASTGQTERSVTELETAVAQAKARASAARVERYRREAAEQAARITAIVFAAAADLNRDIARRPKPAPVTGFAPGGTLTGRVYTNSDLRPAFVPPREPADRGPGRVIVDVAPGTYRDIDLQDAVRSGRCAAFSFVNADGETVNRLWCDPVVAR